MKKSKQIFKRKRAIHYYFRSKKYYIIKSRENQERLKCQTLKSSRKITGEIGLDIDHIICDRKGFCKVKDIEADLR